MSKQDDKMRVEPTYMAPVSGEKRHSDWDVNVVMVRSRCKALEYVTKTKASFISPCAA